MGGHRRFRGSSYHARFSNSKHSVESCRFIRVDFLWLPCAMGKCSRQRCVGRSGAALYVTLAAVCDSTD